jgi:hypothetical protein
MSGHDVRLEAALRYILDELEKKFVSLPDPLPVLRAYPPAPGATEETRTRCGKCRNKRSGRNVGPFFVWRRIRMAR